MNEKCGKSERNAEGTVFCPSKNKSLYTSGHVSRLSKNFGAMDLRDILVHLNSHELWSSHIDYAIQVAKLFGGRLSGLATFPEAALLRRLPPYEGHGLEEQVYKDQQTARMLGQRFLDACASAQVSARFDVLEAATDEFLPVVSRLYDLTIVQRDPPASNKLDIKVAERLALRSGRPVLIVPEAAKPYSGVEHALVVWNGSQSAASAVHCALPFLQRARRVTVCECEMRHQPRPMGQFPKISISEHLSRYVSDLTLEQTFIENRYLGYHLLQRASVLDCDMIVLGAARGRRWLPPSKEELFEALLEQTSVPLLSGG